MEWLRDWIMQVAGIIVLGAVCDMIMTDGTMKKYVKIVLGLVLVFAVIKPIANISPASIEIASPDSGQTKAAEMKNRLDEKEQELVFRLYREKLQQNIENHVYTQWNCEANAHVTVEEDDEKRFGNINSVHLKIRGAEAMDTEVIRKNLSEKFDVKLKYVEIDRV